MKNIFLAFFCLLGAYIFAQSPANDINDNNPVERLGQMGKAYVSEVKKVANISYNSEVSLTVNIRKERNLLNNTVTRDIYFSGSNAEGPCEGFIDAGEADDAINALTYIIDSLLPRMSENELHFAKRFTNSNFVIYASYTPSPGKNLSKGEWEIYLLLNERENAGNQGVVHIKKGDVSTLLQILLACKEKLETF